MRFPWSDAKTITGFSGTERRFDEYYFKDFPPSKKGGMWACEIAKFNWRRRPIVVYLVERRRGDWWSCDCPAGRDGRCKHVSMVRDWVARGMPAPFERWEKS